MDEEANVPAWKYQIWRTRKISPIEPEAVPERMGRAANDKLRRGILTLIWAIILERAVAERVCINIRRTKPVEALEESTGYERALARYPGPVANTLVSLPKCPLGGRQRVAAFGQVARLAVAIGHAQAAGH